MPVCRDFQAQVEFATTYVQTTEMERVLPLGLLPPEWLGELESLFQHSAERFPGLSLTDFFQLMSLCQLGHEWDTGDPQDPQRSVKIALVELRDAQAFMQQEQLKHTRAVTPSDVLAECESLNWSLQYYLRTAGLGTHCDAQAFMQ